MWLSIGVVKIKLKKNPSVAYLPKKISGSKRHWGGLIRTAQDIVGVDFICSHRDGSNISYHTAHLGLVTLIKITESMNFNHFYILLSRHVDDDILYWCRNIAANTCLSLIKE